MRQQARITKARKYDRCVREGNVKQKVPSKIISKVQEGVLTQYNRVANYKE